MQIIPFLSHYPSVCTNSDISSFSLISCIVISVMLRAKVTGITTQEERSEDTEAVKWVRIRTKSTF